MGAVWKNQPTFMYLPERKLLHIFIQMIIRSQSQPILWTGKVPTGRDLHTGANYCTCVVSRRLKDIGVLFNNWK